MKCYYVNEESFGDEAVATEEQIKGLLDEWYDEDQDGDRDEWEAEARSHLIEISEDAYNLGVNCPHAGILAHLAERVMGMHVEDPESMTIINSEDWAHFYPLADDEGFHTGEIVGSQEDGYINWNDEAMIARCDAVDFGDGYGRPKNYKQFENREG